jgi:hypothetical protein
MADEMAVAPVEPLLRAPRLGHDHGRLSLTPMREGIGISRASWTRAGRQPSPQPISESGRLRGTVSRAQLRCQGPGGPMPEPKGPKSGGPEVGRGRVPAGRWAWGAASGRVR